MEYMDNTTADDVPILSFEDQQSLVDAIFYNLPFEARYVALNDPRIETWSTLPKSAYEVAVDEGFVGTEEEWLESLIGADGAAGAQGPAGPQGPAGADGATGATGPAGPGDVSFQEYTDSAILALADAHKMIQANKATAMNITVPPSGDVAFNIGTSIAIIQLGAGQVTIVAGSGVTLRNASTLKTRAQYSVLSLTKAATDTWYVAGDME
jgi:hypothetical protein